MTAPAQENAGLLNLLQCGEKRCKVKYDETYSSSSHRISEQPWLGRGSEMLAMVPPSDRIPDGGCAATSRRGTDRVNDSRTLSAVCNAVSCVESLTYTKATSPLGWTTLDEIEEDVESVRLSATVDLIGHSRPPPVAFSQMHGCIFPPAMDHELTLQHDSSARRYHSSTPRVGTSRCRPPQLEHGVAFRLCPPFGIWRTVVSILVGASAGR